MASRTLDVATLYADGTTLNAYSFGPYADNPDGTAPPAATATAVSSGGTVTFTGLADGTRYYAGTGTGGYQYFGFSTPAASVSGASGDGSPFLLRHPRITPKQSFQSAAGLTVQGTGATATLDTGDLPGAVRVVGTAGNAVILAFPFAADLTQLGAALKLKMNNMAAMGAGSYLQAEITSSGNVFSFSPLQLQKAWIDRRLAPSGEWTEIPLVFGTKVGDATSQPTYSAITHMRLNCLPTAGQAIDFSIQLAGTFPLEQFGTVACSFDDTYAGQYEAVKMLAVVAGMPSAVWTIMDQIGQPGRMTLAQLYDLQENYNAVICCHANTLAEHNDATLVDRPDDFRKSIESTYRQAVAYGFNGASHYAYAPNYDGNRETANAQACYRHVTQVFSGIARPAVGNGFLFEPAGQVPIRRSATGAVAMFNTPSGSVNVAAMQDYLNRAEGRKGQAHMLYHDVLTPASDNGLFCSRATFVSHVNELATRTNLRKMTPIEQFSLARPL